MVLMERALSSTGRWDDAPEAPDNRHCRVVVIGVGGCGNNTVTRLKGLGVRGAEVVAMNTDAQHLSLANADRKILIGSGVTHGRGAGSVPSLGREAMMESIAEVEELTSGADLVFVAAGMGGGTGTGAAPVIADIARRQGAVVIGVVTMPFRHEKKRVEYAVRGLNTMRRASHTTIIIDNNRLMELVPQLPLRLAFQAGDDVICTMVRGVIESLTLPSLINLDFADLRTVMTRGGAAVVGLGQSNSPNRAEAASKNALSQMMLDADIKGAKGVLIHVSGGEDLTLGEAVRAAEVVTESIGEEALVIWGSRVDPALNTVIRVNLVVTGVTSPYAASGYEAELSSLYNVDPWESNDQRINLDLDLYNMEESLS